MQYNLFNRFSKLFQSTYPMSNKITQVCLHHLKYKFTLSLCSAYHIKNKQSFRLAYAIINYQPNPKIDVSLILFHYIIASVSQDSKLHLVYSINIIFLLHTNITFSQQLPLMLTTFNNTLKLLSLFTNPYFNNFFTKNLAYFDFMISTRSPIMHHHRNNRTKLKILVTMSVNRLPVNRLHILA